jgi:type 1 fimbria pilin
MSKTLAALGACAAVMLACSFAPPVFAQGMGNEATIKGEVVDTACFLFMGKRGEAHKQCAEACLKAGQDLGIYDEASDTVYFLAGEKPGVNPNDPVKNYVAQNVEVKGMTVQKAKAHGIVIKSVKPL